MKKTKYYLAISDGEATFYPRNKAGLDAMASLYNNLSCRFFDIVVENEIEITYGTKVTQGEPMPNMADDFQED